MTASSVNDFCHLPRDLSVGDVGGDVHCLQRALRRGEFSNVAPSGRFDEATREGVKRWTTANGWSNRTGSVDASVRSAYAEANDYATMSSGRLVNDCANGKNVDGLACVDVCAEFGEDSQFCRTKCAPRGDADKKYACRAACQDAIAGACDRAFPPTSEDNRKRFEGCLEHTAEECASACDRWR